MSGISNYKKYFDCVPKDTLENLNEDAFIDTLKVILGFFEEVRETYTTKDDEDIQYPSWVCNSPPGHGKTTALQSYLKNIPIDMPVLIALKDTEHMKKMRNELLQHNPDEENYVLYVDHKDSKNLENDIPKHQIVIISHQRLRNLAMRWGNLNTYLYWKPYINFGSGFVSSRKRTIIIDEMPIFVNSVAFDVGADDNAVKWFDDCAKGSKLSEYEKAIARGAIAISIAKEIIENDTTITNALIKQLESMKLDNEFNSIIGQIESKNVQPKELESLNKFNWFLKLLRLDGAGRIESNKQGKKIICAERVNYKGLNTPILIFDGTAEYTPSLYNKEFEYQLVRNYNDYNRVYLLQRTINTSAERRRKSEKTVQQAISYDIKEIRDKGAEPFPLVAKMDIDVFKANGVITKQYMKFYEQKVTDNDDLPLNVLNTTGKNRLQEYNFLYLTSLPIMKPEHYKQIAISLYDSQESNVNIDFAVENQGQWFADDKVEQIYYECVISELIQIVHRSKLRRLNEMEERIFIGLATNKEKIVKKLQIELGVPEKNLITRKLFDGGIHKFNDKVEKLAQGWFDWAELNKKSWNKGFPCTIGKIDKKDKKFINDHWEEGKIEIIERVLAKFNIKITVGENGYKTVDWIEEPK